VNETRSFELSRKGLFSNYDETKSKEEKNKTNKIQKVHFASRAYDTGWWKQDNIKMALSGDHTSCGVDEDLTVT